jgi:hypothetical protein
MTIQNENLKYRLCVGGFYSLPPHTAGTDRLYWNNLSSLDSGRLYTGCSLILKGEK